MKGWQIRAETGVPTHHQRVFQVSEDLSYLLSAPAFSMPLPCIWSRTEGRFQSAAPCPPSADLGPPQTTTNSFLPPGLGKSFSSCALLPVPGKLLSYTQRKVSFTSQGAVHSHVKKCVCTCVCVGGVADNLYDLPVLISHFSQHTARKVLHICYDFSLFLFPSLPQG